MPNFSFIQFSGQSGSVFVFVSQEVGHLRKAKSHFNLFRTFSVSLASLKKMLDGLK